MPDLEACATRGPYPLYVSEDRVAAEEFEGSWSVGYDVPIKKGFAAVRRRILKRRTCHRNVFRLDPSMAPITFNRNSSNNALHSLLRRSARDNGPQPDLSCFYRPELQCHFGEPEYSEEECECYLESTGWSAAKKDTWRNKIFPLLPEIKSNLFALDGNEHDMFLKNETYPNDKRPRAIQNTQPGLKAIQAISLWRYNKEFFDLPYFPKHLDMASRVEKMESISRRYFYGTDFTSFESSICRGAQKLERKYFELALPPSLEHVSSKSVSAIIPSVRMSGDYQTSLGNSIVNYCMNASFLDANVGSGHWDILVEGDDAFVTTDYPVNVEKWQDFMRDNGFSLKVVAAQTAGQVGFCELFFGPYGRYHAYPTLLHKSLVGPYRPAISVNLLQRARILSYHLECPDSYLFYRMAKKWSCGFVSLDDNAYELENAPGPIVKRGGGEAYCRVDVIKKPRGDTDCLYGISRVMVHEVISRDLPSAMDLLIRYLDYIELESPMNGPYHRFVRKAATHYELQGPLYFGDGQYIDLADEITGFEGEQRLSFGHTASQDSMMNRQKNPKNRPRASRRRRSRRQAQQNAAPVVQSTDRVVSAPLTANLRPIAPVVSPAVLARAARRGRRRARWWSRYAGVNWAEGHPGRLNGTECLYTIEHEAGQISSPKSRWVMTTNPCYWSDTRTQAIASTFMSVQIKRITIEYHAAATALDDGQIYLAFFRNEDLALTTTGLSTAESHVVVRANQNCHLTMSPRYLMNPSQKFNQGSPAEFPVMVALLVSNNSSGFEGGTINVNYEFEFQSQAVMPFDKAAVRVKLTELSDAAATLGAAEQCYLIQDGSISWSSHLVYSGTDNGIASVFSKLLKIGKKVICQLEPTGTLKAMIDGVSAFVKSATADSPAALWNDEENVETVAFIDKANVSTTMAAEDAKLYVVPDFTHQAFEAQQSKTIAALVQGVMSNAGYDASTAEKWAFPSPSSVLVSWYASGAYPGPFIPALGQPTHYRGHENVQSLLLSGGQSATYPCCRIVACYLPVAPTMTSVPDLMNVGPEYVLMVGLLFLHAPYTFRPARAGSNLRRVSEAVSDALSVGMSGVGQRPYPSASSSSSSSSTLEAAAPTSYEAQIGVFKPYWPKLDVPTEYEEAIYSLSCTLTADQLKIMKDACCYRYTYSSSTTVARSSTLCQLSARGLNPLVPVTLIRSTNETEDGDSVAQSYFSLFGAFNYSYEDTFKLLYEVLGLPEQAIRAVRGAARSARDKSR